MLYYTAFSPHSIALAGLFGPMIMNAIYNAGGRYQPAFLVAAVLAVFGEVLIMLLARKLK